MNLDTNNEMHIGEGTGISEGTDTSKGTAISEGTVGSEGNSISEEVLSNKSGNTSPETLIKEAVDKCEKLLIGIGESFDNDLKAQEAYKKIADMVSGRDFFIISVCGDGKIEETGIDKDRICSPEGEEMKNFDEYNEWIARTLNRELVILELGVGLKFPFTIRFPFEKIAFFNKKAVMFRVHDSLYQSTEEIKEKCIPVKADPVAFVVNKMLI
ncbi:MAG: hypothetical protein K5662_03955 [Lachnospiraceae bacterium]|nr:hypothetical protein [Lachnospiraceae bacterium]